MWPRLWALGLTKFLGNFNDNALKAVAMFVALAREPDPGVKASLVAIASMVFMTPFFVFPTLAGWAADRWPRRTVLYWAKVAELLISVWALVAFMLLDSMGWWPLMSALGLMALQSTFFSPTFMGFLPEVFSERELSDANGILELIAYAGIILGCGFGFYGQLRSDVTSVTMGLPFVVIAALGVLAAHGLPRAGSQPDSRAFGWWVLLSYLADLKLVLRPKTTFMVVLGHTLFMSLGVLLMTSLVPFGTQELGLPGFAVSLLQVLAAVGIGVGAMVAGKYSRGGAELGLVPIGVLGTTVFLANLTWCTGFADTGLMMFMLGFFGGVFDLPLLVYLQERTASSIRGRTLAMTNAVAFFGMFIVSALMLVLTGGLTGDLPADSDFWTRARESFLTLPMRQLYVGAAAIFLLASLVVFWVLPEFLARLLVLLLTRLVYHLRIIGLEHLPTRGPALLLANSVSFVDGLLVAAASSRPIYFVIGDEYLRRPWVRPFRRWGRLIGLPPAGHPVALAKALERCQAVLRAGELLCVFPEGNPTGNGLMGAFKEGYRRMLPSTREVPVIPVHLGLVWGSIFSRKYGEVRPRRPRALPYPVTISFGQPLAADPAPSALRLALSELATETEMPAQPDECTLAETVIQRLRRQPLVRLVKDSSGVELRNFELLARAHIVAARLRPRLAPDERYVGLVLPASVGAVVSTLAVMLCDRVPVFINFTASKSAQEHAMGLCQIRTLLTSQAFIEKARLEPRPDHLPLETLMAGVKPAEKLAGLARAIMLPAWLTRRWYFPREGASVQNPATVLFSSGSTGIPKGAVLTHHNFSSNLNAVARVLGLDDHDTLLGTLPFFHSFGFMATLWLPLTWGLRVVYHPNPLDAAKIGELVASEKATMVFATPTFLQGYLRKIEPEQFRTLRMVITGAEKLPPSISDAFFRKFGVMPIEGYGTTELSPVVSINLPANASEVGKKIGKPGSIGQAIPGVTVKIVDPMTGAALPENQEGLLLVKGPNVMQGYLNEPDKTAAVLRGGYYNTGDMARMDDDGYLYITGRLSRFSKIAGEMIPHLAVEEAMAQVLGLEETRLIVTGVSDAQRGERLVVLHLPLPMPAEDLIKALRQKGLPNLWIPKASDFHEVALIPLLGSGKLDLSRIQEIARERFSTSG